MYCLLFIIIISFRLYFSFSESFPGLKAKQVLRNIAQHDKRLWSKRRRACHIAFFKEEKEVGGDSHFHLLYSLEETRKKPSSFFQERISKVISVCPVSVLRLLFSLPFLVSTLFFTVLSHRFSLPSA